MFEPVTLQGVHVRLEPLSMDHLGSLCEVGLDPELWRWTSMLIRDQGDMRRYIEEALAGQSSGTALPFATFDRKSDRVVGSTRFGSIDQRNRRAEVGWTWIARPWQRTAVNTEAKYLMLRHGFEERGCIRIEFKTDSLNVQSRQALLRIGAREEGIMRKHMVTEGGRIRDSVYFSILDTEWPAVKRELEAKLTRLRVIPNEAKRSGAK